MAATAQGLRGHQSALDRASIGAQFTATRVLSERLIMPLSAEDACVQSMPDASPAKWHLAHVTWFFETFVLEREWPGFEPFHTAFRELFNSYYNAVGRQYPRPGRGMLTRPALKTVLDYRRHVDTRIADIIADAGDDVLWTIELGVHHEQQHQELLLMDVKHLLSLNPLYPAYHESHKPRRLAPKPLQWNGHDGGLMMVGHMGDGFSFDNETPAHKVYLEPYQLASRSVTNGEFLAFIEDRGYRLPTLWLADGWSVINREGWLAPAYWIEREGAWMEFTLGGLEPVELEAPVCHISYYEADAYARWAGARLPSEFEWEAAAKDQQVRGNFLDSGRLHPCQVRSTGDAQQLFGDVWEWTHSAYTQYPGFKPASGAVGEYNGKFMSNQMVLKGGGCVTPSGHVRATYRNFFYPHNRWQFAGLRLARN